MGNPVHLRLRKIHPVQQPHIGIQNFLRFPASAAGPVGGEQESVRPEPAQYLPGLPDPVPVRQVRQDGGEMESYGLGRIRLSQEPDVILDAGTPHIIAYARQYMIKAAPYLIDREKGTVSVITCDEYRVKSLPLEECTDPETGLVAEAEGEPLFPLTVLADGKTVLIYPFMYGALVLLKPDTLLS